MLFRDEMTRTAALLSSWSFDKSNSSSTQSAKQPGHLYRLKELLRLILVLVSKHAIYLLILAHAILSKLPLIRPCPPASWLLFLLVIESVKLTC